MVLPEQWRSTGAGEDPLADHRPEAVDCSASGWRYEGGGIEIDTGACNYLSLSQPLAVDLAAGETIRIAAWWQSLASVEPAEGHLAVLIDDEVVWQERVPIPGPADIRRSEVTMTTAVPAGAPVTLHLHNHGYNTWRFQDLSIVYEENNE